MSQKSEKEEASKKEAGESSAKGQGGASSRASEKKGSKKQLKRRKEKGQKSGVISFGKNIEIYFKEPVPEYDVGEVKAYRAKRKDKLEENFFVLVCERHLIPRTRAMVDYGKFYNETLISLVDFGVVYWEPKKQERFVIVYEGKLGPRLMEKGAPLALGWKQDDVMQIVVGPIVQALVDFRDRSFFHGGIRPDNMFNQDKSKNFTKVVLGDCLSTPASYGQPALFEPVERAMAVPIARGAGTRRDDLYAFGVSLAVIMRSRDPLEGLSDDEVVKKKIEYGSYVAITGKDRFKGSILELLRGLLHDDPVQRWTIDEVQQWLDGLRLSPKQAQREKKATRPIVFMEEKYYFRSFLAMDLGKDLEETARLVESDELVRWVERSADDEELATRVGDAVWSVKEGSKGAGHQDRMAAYLSSALDPIAPIRYKELRLNGEGIGSALAKVLVLKEDVKDYAFIFSDNIAMNWVTGVQNPNLDVGVLVGKYDSCRTYLLHGKVGFGIERCVYTLLPDAHCLSEKLIDYVVADPESMLLAFEDLCQRGLSPAYFLDRHSVAFLSIKDSKCVDSCLYDLAAPEEYKKISGNLKCLAMVQKRGNVKKVPGIAKAFVEMLPAVYARYHDAETKASLVKEIDRYASVGDLVKMSDALTNVDRRNRDINEFKGAMKEYASIRDEVKLLSTGLEQKAVFGRGIGHEVSAMISCGLTILIMLGFAYYYISSGSIPDF